MKKLFPKVSKLGLFIAAAMLVTLGTVWTGTSQSYAAGNNPVPFKGSFSGQIVLNGPLAVGTTADLSGTGNSTHLGRDPYQARVTITAVSAGGVTDVMTETLTAANGDTLTFLCTQVATQLAPGVFHGIDQWTVTGGTGKFSGASGSGTGETQADFNTGTFSKQYSGFITTPKGN